MFNGVLLKNIEKGFKMRSIQAQVASNASVLNRSRFESLYVYHGATRLLVLLFKSTQIDHSIDKRAVFIVKCLQALCVVMNAVVCSSSCSSRYATDLLDQA